MSNKIIDNVNIKSDQVVKDDRLAEKNSSVNALTLGQQLRLARETKKISQEMIAKQLFVSQKLINDLENDDYSKMVAPVYVRGYIVSYARLLQIPIEPLLIEFAKIESNLNCGNNNLDKNVSMKTLGQLPGNDLAADLHGRWLVYVAIIIVLATLVLWTRHHYEQHLAIKTLEKAMPAPAAAVESAPATTAAVPTTLPLPSENANASANVDNTISEGGDASGVKVENSSKAAGSADNADKDIDQDRNFQD